MGKRQTFVLHRDVVMVLSIAAIFLLAVVYSVFSATTIGDNVSTGGTLSVTGRSTLSDDASFTDVHASSTVQATGNALFYASVGVGGTTSPAVALSGTNAYFTGGLGIGYATTGSGNLLVNDLAVIKGRLGVNATTSPTVEFGVIGSGYVDAGFGVGNATTGSGNLLVNSLGVFRGRLGVNATTSPTVEFGVIGSGYVDAGFGVGYATTGIGNFVASDLGVFRNRLGVNATTSPSQQLGVLGDVHAGPISATASTTITLESGGVRAGCIELRDSNGAWVSIYAGQGSATSTTATTIATRNQFQGGAGTGILVIAQGRCDDTD